MINIFKRIPLPMSGLMLGLAAAGNLIASYGIVYKNIFGTISVLLLLLILGKILVDSKTILEDMNNPVIAGVAPTFSMGIMILSTYIKSASASISYFMWIIGIVLHLLLIIYFTVKYIFSFNIKKVFPTYFVVYVGIAAASVTAPIYNSLALGKAAFWFGFAAYLILLPVVLYRVLNIKAIPEPALPTLTIFAAPVSLCLAGYMSSFQSKNMVLIWFLVVLSSITLLAVILYLPKMLRLRFYPSYSAFTFPIVISAIALKSTNAFLTKSGIKVAALIYAVKLEELLAVCLVIYVLIRYIDFLFLSKPAKVAVKA